MLRAKSGIIARGAGEDDDLETVAGGAVEHALKFLNAVGIGVCERVVKDDRQTSIVLGGEDFGHGQAQGGGGLLTGAGGEGFEFEGGGLMTGAGDGEFTKLLAGGANVDAGAVEDAVEVRLDTLGKPLAVLSSKLLLFLGEQLLKQLGGFGTGLFAGELRAGESFQLPGGLEIRLGIRPSVGGEDGTGLGAVNLGLFAEILGFLD